MNQTHPTAEQIVDYLHGELGPAEDAALSAHLRTCNACAQARDGEAALTELLRAHAKAEERELPASVPANVRHAVKTPRSTPLLEQLASAFRPAIALPAIAAVVVLLAVGVGAWQDSLRSTPIAAAYYVNSHAEMSTVAPFADDLPVSPVLANETH